MSATPSKRLSKYYLPAGLALAGGILGYCLTSGPEHIDGMGGIGAGPGIAMIQVIKTTGMVLFIGFLGFAFGMILNQFIGANRNPTENQK
ncbi:MAG: hypothetical protein QM703_10380 [Gemmatales bacterium]